MSRLRFDRVLTSLGWCLFVLAVGAPLLALLIDLLRVGEPPRGGWWLTGRQWELLGKSILLAATSGVFGLLLALPGAISLSRSGGLVRSACMTLLVIPLLFPPTVLAFGWDQSLSADAWLGRWVDAVGLSSVARGPIRTVWVWSCWLWPIGSMILAFGWRRAGRPAFEMASLDAGRVSAFFFSVLPAIRVFCTAAWTIMFLVCLTDYQVPHACAQIVFATELLSWVTETGHSIDVAWPSLPMVLAMFLPVMLLLRRARQEPNLWETQTTHTDTGTWAWFLPVAILFGVTVVLPVSALVRSTEVSAALRNAWVVYGGDLLQSVGLASIAAFGGMLLGEVFSSDRRSARLGAVMLLTAGLLPAALIGQSLVTAYIHVPLVYHHWPVMALTYVARFGWISLLAAWLARSWLAPHVLEQASVDGADELRVAWHVRWPLTWPVSATGVAAFLALALAETCAISLTRVPGIGNVALSLIEKFHRFEDDMLVALSLWLSAAVLPAAALVLVALHRRRSAAP